VLGLRAKRYFNFHGPIEGHKLQQQFCGIPKVPCANKPHFGFMMKTLNKIQGRVSK
jgi:hypothetical protein